LEGENPRRRDAVPGVTIKALPLGRLMVGADDNIGGRAKVKRMQPDAAQQQGKHGQADN
jgi:hypothetical protein